MDTLILKLNASGDVVRARHRCCADCRAELPGSRPRGICRFMERERRIEAQMSGLGAKGGSD